MADGRCSHTIMFPILEML